MPLHRHVEAFLDTLPDDKRDRALKELFDSQEKAVPWRVNQALAGDLTMLREEIRQVARYRRRHGFAL